MTLGLRWWWLGITASAIPGLAACTQGADQGPFLTPSRVVTLQETESDFIGKPGGLLPLPDGSFIVADFFSNTAIRFDSTGSLLRVFGRDGSELVRLGSIGGAMYVADDVLGIVDFSPRQIGLFDLNTGDARGSIPYEGLVTAAIGDDDGAWVAGIGADGKGLARIDGNEMDAAVRGAPSSVALDLVELPSIYLRSEPVRGIYGLASLGADQPSGLLLALAADTTLLRVDLDGQIRGEVYVPEEQRTGVPDDFERKMDPAQRGFDELFGMASAIMAVSSDEAGFVYVAHLDASRSGGTISGRLYLSIVAKDGSRACVDQKVQSSGFGAPVVALRGNRAFVVDQRPPANEGARFESVLRVFELDWENCDMAGVVGVTELPGSGSGR